MNEKLQIDLENMASILDGVRDLSVEYLKGLDQTPTGMVAPAFQSTALPETGWGAATVQEKFRTDFLPNIVASSGSRYWGFVTGGTTPAAIAGDWLTTVLDQNTQSPKGNGDVSALLELETLQLLLQLFSLPDDFMGAFVSGATMSNFTGLAVARQWISSEQGYDAAREGILIPIKVYAATPHSSVIKALSMLGIGSNQLIWVPTLPGRECMDGEALENMLAVHPDEPFVVVSSGGTVNTVDFDDLQFIASLKSRYRFWWHVDAAFGGFAACSETTAHLLGGWQHADSITIDNHKWLNVPYDSAVIFTKKEHALLQVQTFQNSNAPYLGDPLEQFTFLNYVPENSRRFRALPAWFTLMAYGKKGYTDIVENNINLATKFGKAIFDSIHFELVAPVRLNTVCFTVADKEAAQEKITALLKELNRQGKVFFTPTVYKNIPCIRAALVNWRTTEKDIEIAIDALETAFVAIR